MSFLIYLWTYTFFFFTITIFIKFLILKKLLLITEDNRTAFLQNKSNSPKNSRKCVWRMINNKTKKDNKYSTGSQESDRNAYENQTLS